MDRFCIKGGVPLRGSVDISGAKNAVLPIMGVMMFIRTLIVAYEDWFGVDLCSEPTSEEVEAE